MPKKTKGTKRKPSRSKKKNNEEIKISFFALVKKMVRSEEFPKVVAVFLALFNGGFKFPDKSIMTSIMLMVSLCI